MSRFNKLAYQALQHFVASKWPRVTLIYGGAGLGKSRILSKMYHKALAQRPSDKPLWLRAPAFATEYALAAQEGRLGSFRERVRSSGFLFLDDLQELKGKEKTIEELLHTFEHIMEQGGKVAVVLESEELSLDFLGKRLASRFLSGLTLVLGQPEPDELKGFAEYWLQGKLAILDPGFVEGLAESARTLRDVKQRSEEFLSYLERKQVRATAGEFAAFWAARQAEMRLAPVSENVLRVVAEMYEIALSDILGRRRFPQIVEARHLAIYAMKTVCQCSYAEMSRIFNKEHGAIIQAYKGFGAKLTANPGLRARLETINQVFSNRSGNARLTQGK